MSRSRAVVILLALTGAWFAFRSTPRDGAPTAGPPRLAVTGDGFAMMHASDRDLQRLTRLDRDGTPRRPIDLAGLGDQVRVIGTTAGAGMIWRDPEDQLRFTVVDDTGARHDFDPMADGVVQLCDGASSNDQRFAVGWLNDRGQIWWLHGPTAAAAAAGDVAALAEPRATWCAVALSGNEVQAFWIYQGKVITTRCNAKRCTQNHGVTGPVSRRAILGLACLRDRCLLVSRAPGGPLEATLVGAGGVSLLTRELPGTPDGEPVAVIAVGAERLAVAFGVERDGGRHVEVVLLDKAGKLAPLWRSPAETAATAPALSWSKGTLAIAWRDHRGDATTVRTATVKLP